MSEQPSQVGDAPPDPVGTAVAGFVSELLDRSMVQLRYDRIGSPTAADPTADPSVLSSASAEVIEGWRTTMTVRLQEPAAGLHAVEGPTPPEPLEALPEAALNAALQFRGAVDPASDTLSPSVRRALRDTVVVEFLFAHQPAMWDTAKPRWLLAEVLEYLIELSGTRVESRFLTHGVVITDALRHDPRISVPYPEGLRAAKRTPLLFDGQRSVLVVDPAGRARTELQQHRLARLVPESGRVDRPGGTFLDSGSLVALATRRFGGVGFFLREDRSIWTFVDGRPLVIRRGEHWSAFPLWLAAALGNSVGGGHAVELVVQAALMVSAGRGGAILGIVDDPASLDGTVPLKDRYDLRNQFDPGAMRPETRLHHLIDAGDLDATTLSRLAALDGATIVDRHGRLLAYGAVVTSVGSEEEGARTAAARTLSERALAVLRVSEDGEIAVFRDGALVTTLLGIRSFVG
jgi:hypothetical protein